MGIGLQRNFDSIHQNVEKVLFARKRYRKGFIFSDKKNLIVFSVLKNVIDITRGDKPLIRTDLEYEGL
jgi:hypothetical protein